MPQWDGGQPFTSRCDIEIGDRPQPEGTEEPGEEANNSQISWVPKYVPTYNMDASRVDVQLVRRQTPPPLPPRVGNSDYVNPHEGPSPPPLPPRRGIDPPLLPPKRNANSIVLQVDCAPGVSIQVRHAEPTARVRSQAARNLAHMEFRGGVHTVTSEPSRVRVTSSISSTPGFYSPTFVSSTAHPTSFSSNHSFFFPPSPTFRSTSNTGSSVRNMGMSPPPDYDTAMRAHQAGKPQIAYSRPVRTTHQNEHLSTPIMITQSRPTSAASPAFDYSTTPSESLSDEEENKRSKQRAIQCEQEMDERGLTDSERVGFRRALALRESNYREMAARDKLSPEMFKELKFLGKGAFGTVKLVEKVNSGRCYAMKVLKKEVVIRKNQMDHVKAERRLLVEADNEWIVKLIYTFQDQAKLYFVMEYVPGGDLMGLLIHKGVFSLELSQFYAAEMSLALEHVHNLGFIHRDMKPDNLLIGADGHLKLTDFGLCTTRHCSNCVSLAIETGNGTCSQRCARHSPVVGTPNYLAPEVLELRTYGELIDWWSVGVILYEMLVGRPPFFNEDPRQTQQNIVNWKQHLIVPGMLGAPTRDLLSKLLTDDFVRISSKEMRTHPFFASLGDWDTIRRATPPHVPELASERDTRYFDGYPTGAEVNGDTLHKPHDYGNIGEFGDFRNFWDDDAASTTTNDSAAAQAKEDKSPLFV